MNKALEKKAKKIYYFFQFIFVKPCLIFSKCFIPSQTSFKHTEKPTVEKFCLGLSCHQNIWL